MKNLKNINSFLMEKKKKKDLRRLPDIYINQNAGDVEANVNAFNSATTTGSPMAMGEGYMKDLYADVQERGREDWERRAHQKLRNRENKLAITRDEFKRKELEKEIKELETKINIVSPHSATNNQAKIERIKKEIADLKHQLAVDTYGPYPNWDKYVWRKIERLEDELKSFGIKENLMDKKLKENLRNVVDVEPKSREVVDPTFAQAVREIKHNDKMRDFVGRLRKAPKEGKETLPSDLRITLDESLFIAEDVGYVIKDVGIDAGAEVDDDIIVGTIYGYEGDTDYEDDFTFKYNKDTDEITLVEIDPIFTDAERGIIKEILKDNIKTNGFLKTKEY